MCQQPDLQKNNGHLAVNQFYCNTPIIIEDTEKCKVCHFSSHSLCMYMCVYE